MLQTWGPEFYPQNLGKKCQVYLSNLSTGKARQKDLCGLLANHSRQSCELQVSEKPLLKGGRWYFWRWHSRLSPSLHIHMQILVLPHECTLPHDCAPQMNIYTYMYTYSNKNIEINQKQAGHGGTCQQSALRRQR